MNVKTYDRTKGHEPSYTQLGVKRNRTSFLCGNRNGHHNKMYNTNPTC